MYAAEAVFPADYEDGTNGHNFVQTILKKNFERNGSE
jgi:hypothetical protein